MRDRMEMKGWLVERIDGSAAGTDSFKNGISL